MCVQMEAPIMLSVTIPSLVRSIGLIRIKDIRMAEIDPKRARQYYQRMAQSTWSRGQAWAIYGFTMGYRFTKEERFLETARRVADYFIRNLPDDYVPYWDFQAENIPDEPRDASAAAIAASGLLELSQFVHDGNAAKKYWNNARSILLSLCTPAYSDKGTASHGLINHCVTSKPADSEIDVSLIYGDYYFIEALLRYRSFQNPAFRNSTN